MKIHQGDALAVLRTMPANRFDGCLTDPPYGLSFMGAAWDHGVPGPELWAALLRVMKPGAYLLAFGGTRTYHRLACSIEDAGFEIRDCLMWMYGQGFPKAKSCLKPAYEPIVLARKRGPMLPLAIDANRIGTERRTEAIRSLEACHGNKIGHESTTGKRKGLTATPKTYTGRWPANVILDEEAAAALDAQSGILTSGDNPTRRHSPKTRNAYGEFPGAECIARRKTDSGGASRFFYCAKASKSERGANTHPTVKPLKLTEHLARLILPPGGGRLIVPFSGSGSEMIGAERAGWQHIEGIERTPEYVAIAERRAAA